jgi:RHS repeat-associated protein
MQVVCNYDGWGGARDKLTGKERDSESGLDNFGARYDSSSLGRFMSPDPKILSIRHIINPQKWNKYAYTINNPLRYFDPNGMEEIEVQLRAFIPQKSVTVMGTTNGRVPQAFLLELVVGEHSDRKLQLNQRTETDNSTRGGAPRFVVFRTVGVPTPRNRP